MLGVGECKEPPKGFFSLKTDIPVFSNMAEFPAIVKYVLFTKKVPQETHVSCLSILFFLGLLPISSDFISKEVELYLHYCIFFNQHFSINCQ